MKKFTLCLRWLNNEIIIEKNHQIFILEILKGKQSSILETEGKTLLISHKGELHNIPCQSCLSFAQRKWDTEKWKDSPKFTKIGA